MIVLSRFARARPSGRRSRGRVVTMGTTASGRQRGVFVFVQLSSAHLHCNEATSFFLPMRRPRPSLLSPLSSCPPVRTVCAVLLSRRRRRPTQSKLEGNQKSKTLLVDESKGCCCLRISRSPGEGVKNKKTRGGTRVGMDRNVVFVARRRERRSARTATPSKPMMAAGGCLCAGPIEPIPPPQSQAQAHRTTDPSQSPTPHRLRALSFALRFVESAWNLAKTEWAMAPCPSFLRLVVSSLLLTIKTPPTAHT